MHAGKPREFVPGQRVAYQNHAANVHRDQKLADVLDQRRGVVACIRFVRLPVSAPCESEHPKPIRETGRKIVEDVRRIA
jgi:hypothetical protein